MGLFLWDIREYRVALLGMTSALKKARSSSTILGYKGVTLSDGSLGHDPALRNKPRISSSNILARANYLLLLSESINLITITM